MKRIKIDSVQVGDIIFTARSNKISKSIRFFTNGTVSHAMICVQHSSFIDSTMNGVHASNLQRELFEDDENFFHFRLKEPASREVLAKITNFARAEIGTRYSLPEAIRSVSGTRKPRLRRQFCSRLVARVYSKAGIDLVPDADYCSPEDLRRSALLMELPVETETVSDDEVLWWRTSRDAVEGTQAAYNTLLDAVRKLEPDVESINDLLPLRIRRPEIDPAIVEAFETSGYLYVWRVEVDKHPWRYDHRLMSMMPGSKPGLPKYCIETLQECYSGGARFAMNLALLKGYHSTHPRESFRLEIELYSTLTRTHQARREVAYAWLMKHHPEMLKQHMEQIEPHSPHWYSIVEIVDPALAAFSDHAVRSQGVSKVCSICADQPATAYRLVNDAEISGVPSLYLCEDCVGIRRRAGMTLEPFFER